MKFVVELEFDYDGMNENDIDEIEKTLDVVFESGAESTCTELTLLSIKAKREEL